MTSMVDRPTEVGHDRQGQGSLAPSSSLLPVPAKPRRRWGLFAAMAALVCLGALGNVWLHQATSNARQVVAARSMIERGTVVTRDQLMTVQIGVDPALHSVPASELSSLVGKRAAVDVAAGTLVTTEATTDKQIPGAGHSLVGVGVMPAMMPGPPLMAGDRIRIVTAPAQQGAAGPAEAPTTVAAVVVSTAATGPTSGQGAQTVITVDVPSGDAAQLAAMAATGKVAVVLDSRDR